MSRRRQLLRLVFLIGLLLGLPALIYALWQPGSDRRDGAHDSGRNGLWLQHGWLGDDPWFQRNLRDPQKFRGPKQIAALLAPLRQAHIHYLFPHIGPCRDDGSLPPLDAKQTEAFLDASTEFQVLPWAGGVFGDHCHLEKPFWRQQFCSSVQKLFAQHPRFAGIQINIEPLPSGNADFLSLLDELKLALPKGKILSVAGYPPPTRWQASTQVHWDEAYFRQVAKRCQLLAPMMYDTGIRLPKFYEALMATWTEEVLSWAGDTPVLLGVPSYDDAGTGYHRPEVENLDTALRGIHAGLDRHPLPSHFRGVAIYCEWEMDPQEWRLWQEAFCK